MSKPFLVAHEPARTIPFFAREAWAVGFDADGRLQVEGPECSGLRMARVMARQYLRGVDEAVPWRVFDRRIVHTSKVHSLPGEPWRETRGDPETTRLHLWDFLFRRTTVRKALPGEPLGVDGQEMIEEPAPVCEFSPSMPGPRLPLFTPTPGYRLARIAWGTNDVPAKVIWADVPAALPSTPTVLSVVFDEPVWNPIINLFLWEQRPA